MVDGGERTGVVLAIGGEAHGFAQQRHHQCRLRAVPFGVLQHHAREHDLAVVVLRSVASGVDLLQRGGGLLDLLLVRRRDRHRGRCNRRRRRNGRHWWWYLVSTLAGQSENTENDQWSAPHRAHCRYDRHECNRSRILLYAHRERNAAIRPVLLRPAQRAVRLPAHRAVPPHWHRRRSGAPPARVHRRWR